MTSPNRDRPPKRRRNRLWRTVGLTFGAGSLVLGAGAAIWAWNFIRNDLTPFLSEQLTDSLDRPVTIGPVERVTLTSIQVGPTEVGATATDPTTVKADSVAVRFNLLGALLSRDLDLNLTLSGAEGYLEQDAQDGWLSVDIPERGERKEPLFEVRLDKINIKDSQVTALPYFTDSEKQTPIQLNAVNGLLDVDYVDLQGTNAQQFRFDLAAEVARGGDLHLTGEIQPQLANETANEPDIGSPLVRSTNLAIQADQVALPAAADFLLATLNQPQLPLTIEDGTASSNLKLMFRPNQPLEFEGTVTVDEGIVQIDQLPQPLVNLKADARLKGSEIFLDQVIADLGTLQATAEGSIHLQEGHNLTARIEDVTVAAVTDIFEVDLPISLTGTFDSEVKVTGDLAQPLISGDITSQEIVTVDKLALEAVTSQFSLQWPDRRLVIDDFLAIPTAGGQLVGQGAIDFNQAPTNFLVQFEGQDLPADAIASIYGIQSPIELGLVNATGAVAGVPNDLETTVRWQAAAAQYPGQGTLVYARQGSDNRLSFRDTTLQVAGGTLSGAGSLVRGDWQANINASEIALAEFSAAIPGRLSGNFDVAGNTQDISLSGIQGQGNFRVQQIAAGTLAGNATLGNGRWGADVNLDGIQLNQLAQTLQGGASGRFLLTGVTNDLSLAAIRAQGDLSLSSGLAAFSPQLVSLNQPLNSTLAWDGQRLLIDRAESAELQASGTVIPLFNGYQFAGIENVDLDLAAQNYPLAAAPFPTPAAVQLGGLATFAGKLTGTPNQPNLDGTLQLNNLAVNQLFFDPVLAGEVNYTQGSLALALAGGQDRIDVNFNSLQDFNFLVGWQGSIAQGQAEGDRLNATLGNFPLAALQLPSSPLGPLRGTISAPYLEANLANQTLVGSIDIQKLGVGHIGVEQVAGEIRYANNLVTLLDGKIFFEDSFYQVNGRLDTANDFAYLADIRTDQGKVQDLLTALSIFEIADLARGLRTPEWIENPVAAEDIPRVLATRRAGSANASLLAQLRRLAELQAIENEERKAAEQAPLPPLNELDGPFAGAITLAGSRSAGVNVDFDLLGNDWRWGRDYAADRVIARGAYNDGMLVFEPLRFESALPQNLITATTPPSPNPESLTPESPTTELGSTTPTATEVTETVPESAFINLAGQFIFNPTSETESNLQLVAKNISVDRLRDIFNLPLSLDGRLNGTATFGGNLDNPQVRGVARLANASINRQPIEAAQAQFLYQEARLSLLSTLTAQDNPEPLRLSAQVPFAFGFMTVQPASDQILLDINVKDEGLALLNILNRQITWESGEGAVSLAVRGTLGNPEIEGFATLKDTTIRSRLLQEPLTQLNGSARFVRDRIIIDDLIGQFSNGQITAAGTFPILFPIITSGELAALGNANGQDQQPEASTTPASIPTDQSAEQQLTDQPTSPSSENDTATDSDASEPLLEAVPAAESPLTIDLNNIALKLPGLYEGGVNGRVVLGGSLLLGGPQLGGKVQLSQGRIFLPENNNSSTTPTASADAVPVDLSTSNLSVTPQFQNLNLTLARSVQVIQGNLLNFFAEGTLRLNGPLTVTDIRPEGTIKLVTGRVQLYTTTFRLSGNENTATFLPEFGLTDPLLDINLRTSVAEARSSGPTTATAFSDSEVTDTSADPFRTGLGSLQTVRIRANVQGPTSQIFNNLELSSSPPRTQNEIIGLIGGSFVTALESTGSGDLSGVLNLFGGVLLNQVQDFVSTTLNLSEFRLFPVTSASRFSNEENTGSTLDLGGEIGFDVSNSFTVSILRILTDSTPTEFNLRYRLNDQFTIRSTTNLDDVNQVLLEFETRF